MTNHPNRSRPSALTEERALLRRTYAAFKSGASLTREEVARLLASRGHDLTANRLSELARDSDRGGLITAEELYALISAWADEQRAARGPG